jgi:hypothetical protein
MLEQLKKDLQNVQFNISTIKFMLAFKLTREARKDLMEELEKLLEKRYVWSKSLKILKTLKIIDYAYQRNIRELGSRIPNCR